ncbi:uncharacterized protein JN550_012879 [Neoarthrinium moseri]|uniref:uncharacterized protein n=1 Tax=Neoarthrinium moseri TaxID=1658444 RepID=UPI001FDD9EA9|nr:uncharacterized protein JN550_012879 [Neoarthrinium moseri]KAI1858057.1 hypothetical protein JN550_012879 [Neoarthrinium moseri]
MADFSKLTPAQLQAVLNGPALKPPEDVTPNFDNPPNDNALAYTALSVCLAVATITMGIRLYSRVVKVRKLRIEDYLACIGFVAYVGYLTTTYMRAAQFGIFVHQWNIRLKDMSIILLRSHVAQNMYPIVMMTMKTAILREWIRIFVPHGQRNAFFWLCTVVLVINLLYYASAIVAVNLTCIPIQATWDFTVKGKCFNGKALASSGVSVNLVSDVIILVLPQKTIWNLNMPRRKKIGVSIVFAVGLFACIAAICRLAASVIYSESSDVTYYGSAAGLWVIAEMTCAFLVFALPAVPRAFTGDGVATQILVSLRAWASISGSRNQSRDGVSSFRSESGSRRGNFSKLNDQGIPLEDHPSTRSNRSQEQPGSVRQTTKIELSSSQYTDVDRTMGHQLHHPWETKQPRTA